METGTLRRLFRHLTICAALTVGSQAIAEPGEIYEIDQIMDMAALTPEDFYRFVPNFLWVEPGDTVRFMNTTGNHTVKSVEGIWPEGVAHIDISNQDVTEVAMTAPGIYGFRCKVHARHGMFALVVVGSPDANFSQVSFDKLNERGKFVFGELMEKLEVERKNHPE